MIGKVIVFKGVDYKTAHELMGELGTKIEIFGTVLDAYTKISTCGMPNGSTSTSTDRTYIVKQHNDSRLVEVSFREVIRLAEPSDFPMVIDEDIPTK